LPTSNDETELVAVLERSRQLGFLGPGPVSGHLEHATAYQDPVIEVLAAVARSGGTTIQGVDLGAGGGVPSLPLLAAVPDLSLVLVDASQRRTSFCLWALVELGLDQRGEVWTGRAEQFGHRPDRRGRYDVVVARGFGPPALTLECAAPLLRVGGRCVVSEPPSPRRWPADGLAQLGMVWLDERPGVAVFELVEAPGSEYPRPIKEQRRRPIFDL
jgi:16S rRNA (guanine527-N7)-methyltransferase